MRIDEIDAAVVFYGTPSPTLADMRTLRKPLQAHFGALDDLADFSDATAAAGLEAQLKMSPAAAEAELHRYEGVGHAFMNELPEMVQRKQALGQTGGANQAIHDPQAIETAWGRVFAFLKQRLRHAREKHGLGNLGGPTRQAKRERLAAETREKAEAKKPKDGL